jgi:amino acid permease
LFAIPTIITLTYLAVIIAINCIINALGSTIPNAASFGDIIAGFLAPYIGAMTIYFVYRAYQKQNESHDLQEKSINF